MARIHSMLHKGVILLSKLSPHKNGISQLTQTTYMCHCHWFSEVPEAADILQNR